MGAPGVDRKVISGLCCVDRMKASVVRPDGVGDGALGDPRDKRRGPCYSALGALQEVVISHDIFSADHHAEVARSRAGISAFSPFPVESQFGYTGVDSFTLSGNHVVSRLDRSVTAHTHMRAGTRRHTLSREQVRC